MTREEEVFALLGQLKRRCAPAEGAIVGKLESEFEWITGQVEALKLVVSDPAIQDEWLDFGLTPLESRLVSALQKAGDKGLSKAALMSAIYYDHDDQPQAKIIDVFLFRIRGKLADSEFRVITNYGRGYKLVSKTEVPVAA